VDASVLIKLLKKLDMQAELKAIAGGKLFLFGCDVNSFSKGHVLRKAVSREVPAMLGGVSGFVLFFFFCEFNIFCLFKG
jgi:hypothetical protein